MRRVLAAAGLVFVAATAAAQTPAASRFEAADVRVRPHATGTTPNMTGGVLRNGRYDLRNATMIDLITTAYSIDADSVLGGPSWLEQTRFDIVAKAPNGTPPATLKAMLETLLAERFGLVARNDTKPVPGFALMPGKAPHKMKTAAGDALGCQPAPVSPPAPGTVPMNEAACRGVTMADFATILRGMAGAYVTGPVTDKTGLTGAFDFNLKWTARGALALAGADGVSIFDAVDKQLGLTLAPQNLEAPVLVVDQVNALPSPNPPGTAEQLPVLPAPEFDVATVKLTPPGAPLAQRIQPGGRVDLQGITLRQLMGLAWNITDDQMLANAPGWLASTRYSLTAVARGSIAGSGNDMQMDIDDLSIMLRTLLAEKFNLKTHFEDRQVNAYTLATDKPKLAAANPADRTRWKEGPAPNAADTRNTNPILSRLVTCQNMTMAEFAENLQNIAPGYVHLPVTDSTGLKGSFSFSFTFTPVGIATGPGRGDAPPAGSAVDPNGAITLFEALNRQLGLKLEPERRTIQVLVIDHVDEKPVDD